MNRLPIARSFINSFPLERKSGINWQKPFLKENME
jgi:hypothetical protein